MIVANQCIVRSRWLCDTGMRRVRRRSGRAGVWYFCGNNILFIVFVTIIICSHARCRRSRISVRGKKNLFCCSVSSASCLLLIVILLLLMSYVEHNVRPIVLGRVCLYCGENIKCGIFFKYPWALWWLGAHDGCVVCSVPSFVVQAVSYCVIKHVTSGPVTIHLRQDLQTHHHQPWRLRSLAQKSGQ